VERTADDTSKEIVKLCALLARHDAGNDRFTQHILRIVEQIEELHPILFYLKPTDVRETIERVRQAG